jgi:SSS family solute:Na+ symporter
MKLPAIDIAVLVCYLTAVVAFGAWFARRTRHTEAYMAADRSLPGWAVGFSIFGSYISSISFLANPGKSYAGNWNAFAFTMATPIAAAIAVNYFVPVYRRLGHVSAYEHLEQRFGAWARTYAVTCYLLTQMARTGTVIYLLGLAVSPLLGWDVWLIIVLTGGLMTGYILLGGMEAVVWTGVLQGVVLMLGPVVCIHALLTGMPGGPGQIFTLAAQEDKFSLGSFGAALDERTFWVVFVYGLVINLQNFGVDQGYVQRYITAKTDRQARASVWLGAGLYVPVAAMFFFIGTALFAWYARQPELLPLELRGSEAADKVFPHFIVHALPAGLSGLVIAGIFAAAMDPSLNSMATLTLCDLYKRYVRPAAGERESMRVLRLATLFWGAASVGVALLMIRVKNALDIWWDMAGVFGGGILGLFLLGLTPWRIGSAAAAAGVVVGVPLIAWIGLSSRLPAAWKCPLDSFLSIVVGTAAILIVGTLAGVLRPARAPVKSAGDIRT